MRLRPVQVAFAVTIVMLFGGVAVARPAGRAPAPHPRPSATRGVRPGRPISTVRHVAGRPRLGPYYYGPVWANGEVYEGEPPPPVAPDFNDVPPRDQMYSEPSSIQPALPMLPPRRLDSKSGGLRLEVAWTAAQVYIDGFYAGTVDDCNRTASGVVLAAGWHRIELRAPGFTTLAANVTIQSERTITYRADLRPFGY